MSVLATGDGSSSGKKPSMDQIRAQLAAASRSSKASKSKLPGFPKAGAGAAAAAGAGSQLLPGVAGSSSELYGGEDDYEEDEDEATPAFQITFDEEGRAVSIANTVLPCSSWKQELALHGLVDGMFVSIRATAQLMDVKQGVCF